MYKSNFLELAESFPMYATVLYAQALHESGNFSSNIFQHTNNPWGMKYPTVRPADNDGYWISGNGTKWSKYTDVDQSIRDRILWDEYNNIQPPVTDADIMVYLNMIQAKGYAEDPNYISKVMQFINSLGVQLDEVVINGPQQNSFMSGISFGMICLFAVVAYVFFRLTKKKSSYRRTFRRRPARRRRTTRRRTTSGRRRTTRRRTTRRKSTRRR